MAWPFLNGIEETLPL